MSEATPYNKIIYKGREDKSNEDLVNPYKHRSTSRSKFQRWSPDVSREEYLKKKLQRENEYIRKLEDEDKPVLMIQQKKVYKNLRDPQFISPESNDFFKVTNQTQVIDDMATHIEAGRDDTRRPTKVMASKAPADQDIYQKGVYKIEGLEYLPEGFLELDPILLMDDYEFETYLDRQKFSEEQRRVKALRRKQYQDRDKARNRKVTIFVVNEYKDRLMEYFEEWYAQNKRKMTKEELEYIANILQSDVGTIGRLQDLFLQRKKVINTNHLHKFEVRNRDVKGLQSGEVPHDMKKLFLTSPTDGYIKAEPRLAAGHQSYNPTYITKYQEKYGRRNRTPNKLSKSQTKLKSAKTQPLDSAAEDLGKFTKDFEVLLGSSAKPAAFQNSNGNTIKSSAMVKTDASVFKNNPDEDLRIYFDEEINAILDRIRACKGNEAAEGAEKSQNQSYIDLHKQRLQNLIAQLNEEEKKSVAKPEVDIAEPIFGEGEEGDKKESVNRVSASGDMAAKKSSRLDPDAVKDEMRKSAQRKKTTLDVIRMESMLLKYNMNPDEFRPKADTTMNQNWMMYDIRPPNLTIPNLEAVAGPTRQSIIGNHRVSTNSPNEDVLASYPVSEFVPIDENEEDQKSSQSIPRSASEQVREKVTTVVNPAEAPVLKPSRVTIISKSKKNFDKITDKFLPHLGKTEYFYEVISDGLPVGGKKQAVLMTMNGLQELILIDELSEDTADKMYKDFMLGVYDKNTYLVVLRNKNQEVVEIFKLSFNDELSEAEVKHMLSLVSDEPLKKQTVIEEFVIPAEAARKASSININRSKSPTGKESMSARTGKAKSVMDPKLSAKVSQAKRLTTKVDDQNQVQEMEEQLDQLHDSGLNQSGQDRNGSKLSFGKQSVNQKDLVKVSTGSKTQADLAPGLEGVEQAEHQEVLDQSEHDRPEGRSVGTGSFSAMKESGVATPKMSVVSSNQLVKKSTTGDKADQAALLKNDGPTEGRMTFQDQSMAESNVNEEGRRSTSKEGKRSSFVDLKNNLVEKEAQIARQSMAQKKSQVSQGKSITEGHAFEEEAEEEGEQPKQRSTRHEEAFKELLQQISEKKIGEDGKRTSASQEGVPKLSAKDADQIRNSIQKMLEGARGSSQGGIMQKFQEELKNVDTDPTLIEQFYQFCREKLPSDQKYKESVLFVSLFYYFLEKKQMIN